MALNLLLRPNVERDFQEFKDRSSGEKKLQNIDAAITQAFCRGRAKRYSRRERAKQNSRLVGPTANQVRPIHAADSCSSDVLIKLVKDRIANSIKSSREIGPLLAPANRATPRTVPRWDVDL